MSSTKVKEEPLLFRHEVEEALQTLWADADEELGTAGSGYISEDSILNSAIGKQKAAIEIGNDLGFMIGDKRTKPIVKETKKIDEVFVWKVLGLCGERWKMDLDCHANRVLLQSKEDSHQLLETAGKLVAIRILKEDLLQTMNIRAVMNVGKLVKIEFNLPPCRKS